MEMVKIQIKSGNASRSEFCQVLSLVSKISESCHAEARGISENITNIQIEVFEIPRASG
jgi:hypothetical protein